MEYILFISVIVIAVVWLVGDGFWPAYSDGLQGMQDSLESMTEDGVVDGR